MTVSESAPRRGRRKRAARRTERTSRRHLCESSWPQIISRTRRIVTRHSLTARREGPPARLPRWGPRSAGDASPLHPNAAAALGPHGLAALLPQIFPILPPHRANHARRGPRFGSGLVSI